MNWLEVLRVIKEEGRKAAKEGKEMHHNPYDFITETAQAYAWEDGHKQAKMEAA